MAQGWSDVSGMTPVGGTPDNLLGTKLPFSTDLASLGMSEDQISTLYNAAAAHDQVLKANYWIGAIATLLNDAALVALPAARDIESIASIRSASGGMEALAARADEIHSALDPIAQKLRTTAVLETSGGNIIAGGARDLSPAQRALLRQGEIAAKLPGADAEVTALSHANRLGLQPRAMAVTRTICPECAATIRASGGTLISPTTAIWPR